VVVLFIPWLASGVVEYAITNPKSMPEVQPYWYSSTLQTAFHTLNRYSNGSLVNVLHQEGLPYTYFAGAFLFAAYAWVSVSTGLRNRTVRWMATAWLLGAVATALFSVVTHSATSGAGLSLLVFARALQWFVRTRGVASGWTAVVSSDRSWGALLILASAAALWVAASGWILFVLGVLLGTLAYRFMAGDSETETTTVSTSRLQYGTALMVLAWAFPFVMPLLTGIFEVQYTIRYTLTALPAYLLLVAHGLASIRVPAWRGLVIALCVVYSLFALRTNYFQPYKENWRDVMSALSHDYRAGDCVIISASDPMASNAWKFYGSRELQAGARVMDRYDPEGAAAECQRIWVVGYLRAPVNTKEYNALKTAIERTHRGVQGREFFWTELVLYERAG
jgi:hypothetical protein